jgi:hypothetical protein
MQTRLKRAATGFAALALATTVGGAATTLPASGAESAATVGAAATTLPASGGGTVHVLRFTSISVKGHQLGRLSFAGVEVDKRKGEVIGFDTVTGKFNRTTHTAHLWVAVSLRGGILHIVGDQTEDGIFTGRVTGGQGRYQGAKGPVSGTQVTRDKTKVLINYTL